MQLKKAKECGLDGKSGSKEGVGDNKAQASEGEHCPTSPASPAEDQVQATPSSPQPSKEGWYCIHQPCFIHIIFVWKYFVRNKFRISIAVQKYLQLNKNLNTHVGA